jgi:hypothetical protein
VQIENRKIEIENVIEEFPAAMNCVFTLQERCAPPLHEMMCASAPREMCASRHKDLGLCSRKRNFQFSIFSFHFAILALCILLLAPLTHAHAQVVSDKMVATVTNGSRATPDLITYSDLVWQLALEPGTQFSERPSSANLNRALRLVEDQILILQEARSCPAPTRLTRSCATRKCKPDETNWRRHSVRPQFCRSE